MKSKNEYIIKEDYAILRIESRKHGVFDIKIDTEDVVRCNEYQWTINKYNRKCERDYFYAISGKVGLLHRFIVNAPKGKDVDHIEGDTLDNRKHKLQICNHNENIMKARTRSDNESGRVGVYFNTHITTPKWMAYININKKRKHLGFFDNIDDAIRAREIAEDKYWADFKPIDIALAK